LRGREGAGAMQKKKPWEGYGRFEGKSQEMRILRRHRGLMCGHT